ncbi:MAG TPA: prolipoprotein diacylglyceryl transferase [Bryobacteraceae bacterium]|nr:prolipoprotein diacylglyceryl transferase [Bryobacteraceae bacterium]
MFPRLISIGNFWIPTYGVLVAIGFLVGLYITVKLAKEKGLPPDQIANLGIYCGIAGLAGGKIAMFLFDWRVYWNNPGEIFSRETLQAAGVYQGGLVLALLVAAWYIHHNKLPWLSTLDVFAPGVAIGHGIGRLGCLAAGCCWGLPTRLPWGITFTNPEAGRLTGVPLGVRLQPTQIYEALVEAAIFGFLIWRIRRPHRAGEVMGLYLVLYSIARFFIEFVREHEQPTQLGLSLTQWIAIATFLLGVWFLLNRTAAPRDVAARHA